MTCMHDFKVGFESTLHLQKRSGTALRKLQYGSIFGDCCKFSPLRINTASADSFKGKIKVQLKLSISRLRMVQQKDTAIAKQQRRAMAVLLEVHIERPHLSASS